jgi:hypothetical protein
MKCSCPELTCSATVMTWSCPGVPRSVAVMKRRLDVVTCPPEVVS